MFDKGDIYKIEMSQRDDNPRPNFGDSCGHRMDSAGFDSCIQEFAIWLTRARLPRFWRYFGTPLLVGVAMALIGHRCHGALGGGESDRDGHPTGTGFLVENRSNKHPLIDSNSDSRHNISGAPASRGTAPTLARQPKRPRRGTSGTLDRGLNP